MPKYKSRATNLGGSTNYREPKKNKRQRAQPMQRKQKITPPVHSQNERGGSSAGVVQQISKKFKVDVDKLSHKAFSHVLQNSTPHEFALVRGLASKFLKIPHPLGGHISKHIDDKFVLPKHINKAAIKDIILAKSPHHLSEMLHSEKVDMDKGMNVGGGLLDGLKTLVKKGLKKGQKFSKGAISVGRSVSKMMSRGIAIAQAIEPVLELIDPRFGDILGKGLRGAENIRGKFDAVLGGVEKVHDMLHNFNGGPAEGAIEFDTEEGADAAGDAAGEASQPQEAQEAQALPQDVANMLDDLPDTPEL